MGASRQTKWDEGAIGDAYEDLLDRISPILDSVKIGGFSRLLERIPLFSHFMKLLSQMENELLIQWKLAQDNQLDTVFQRQKSWLHQELRQEDSFFDTYNALVAELWGSSFQQTPLSGEDLWRASVLRHLTDQDLLSDITGGLATSSSDIVVGNVSHLLYDLYKVSPYHLCLSFLNLIEIGTGPRPEINNPGRPAETNEVLTGFSGIHRLFQKSSEANSPEEIQTALTRFWDFGSGGEYSLYPAFIARRAHHGSCHLEGITPRQWAGFDSLFGIEANRKLLETNTLRFLSNTPAHHTLLWGGRGTGKSSSVMALLKQYYQQGLRLIEIQQKDLDLIPAITRMLSKKKEKFVLFCDDLSFDQDDVHYKHLKTVMQGSIAGPPDNLLFIATANRKDLVFRGELDERMPEQRQLIDEKRAIDDRFGLKLFYDVPVFKELADILYYRADITGLSYDHKSLLNEFRIFAQRNNHDKPAGRTVQQFIQEWTHSQKRD